ncbi:hypothetical protein CIW52_03815 [Mycolicibacterium sp. P9-64]|jgi:hypothetical protein|uniref:hypothetical protein n=1 Tax=Mycolicibacterium sp. P9-64 TaxID=2024612 RepID=UPI0011EFA57A|nr:hypothetical protein [Mycolicibacterium sp. P9-64]KAA0087006.1 hypothetical protein CIW52_03815 [Mycolicibacterium sp. P9-64]
MHDRDTIEGELRVLVAVRALVKDEGGDPSTVPIDGLLDELAAVIAASREQSPAESEFDCRDDGH